MTDKSILLRLLIINLLSIGLSFSDVISLDGNISFDVNSDGNSEMTLNNQGLGLPNTSGSNLEVQGNTIISHHLMIGQSESSSNLNIAGSFAIGSQTYSSSSNIGNYSMSLLDPDGNSDLYALLPTASNAEGRIIHIKKTNQENAVYIYGSDNIDLFGDVKLNDLASIKLFSNGSQWYILNTTGSIDYGSSLDDLSLFLDFDFKTSDISSNFNHGTLIGSTLASANVSGVFDTALNFDGIDDYIVIDDETSLDLSNQASLSFWIKPSSNTTSQGTQSNWIDLEVPALTASAYNSDMTFIQVGNTLKFVAYINTSTNSDDVIYGESDLQFNGLTWTDFNDQPSTTGSSWKRPLALTLASDGEKLFMSTTLKTNPNEYFYTASSNLDFNSGNVTWSSNATPLSGGGSDHFKEPGSADVVLVDDVLYFASYQHNGATERVRVSSANIDGSSTITWSDPFSGITGAGATGENSSVGIDSDGEKLYYVFFSTEGVSESLFLASSNLDFSGAQVSSIQTSPGTAVADGASHVDLCLAGGKLHYALAIESSDNVELFTAHSNIDGTGLSSWVSRGFIYDSSLTEGSTCSIEMNTSGSNLRILSFVGNSAAAANVMACTIPLDNGPILTKPNAYSVNYTGGGLVFDWAGTPISFGNLSTDEFSHVVITYDGSIAKFYINNIEVRRQTCETSFINSSSNLMISGDGSQFYNGDLDDLRIYNRALNTDEINNLYQ